MPLLTNPQCQVPTTSEPSNQVEKFSFGKCSTRAAHHIFSISWSPGPFAHGVQPLHSRCANSLFRIFIPTE